MNSGYTKLFGDIVTSTIWQQPNNCKVLWITMLALKDKDHICRATVPGLAKLADVPLSEVEKYLEQFQKPDKYSRSQEFEGRRIEAVDGGWLILNGPKYQDRMNADDRKEQVRAAVARHRAKAKELEKQLAKIDPSKIIRAPGTKKYPLNTKQLGPVRSHDTQKPSRNGDHE